MKKHHYAGLILMLLLCSAAIAESIDYSTMLGFNGLFRENSWTPLIVRLRNNGPSISGHLKVLTDNSGTATEQIREYVKPADLPSGSDKVFIFNIPLGHHNRDLQLTLEGDGEIYLDEKISLKQRRIRGHFLLGVSPYPDLPLSPDHPVLNERTISYPHPDNLPESRIAYDSVQIVSIHRNIFDKLSNRQFHALTGWVSEGGVLVVWGGKSPSPEQRQYLPASISGLIRLSGDEFPGDWYGDRSESTIMVNRISVPPEYRISASEDLALGSYKKAGRGSVFFFPFDYSGELRNWKGLDDIWAMIDKAVPAGDTFPAHMDGMFLLEDYIRIFDNSGFTYLDHRNVALILFLSASLSISFLILIRLRRKSRHIHELIAAYILLSLILSATLFAVLYNKRVRQESFALDLNLIYQNGPSDKALFFKDLLVGSSATTQSDIILPESTDAIIKRKDNENLRLLYRPELILEKHAMDQWTSRTFRFEETVDSLVDLEVIERDGVPEVSVVNKSDYFLHESFVLYRGSQYRLGNIFPNSKSVQKLVGEPGLGYFNKNQLLSIAADIYIKNLIDEERFLFCSFISDEIKPIEFSNSTWKKKSVTVLLNSLDDGGNLP